MKIKVIYRYFLYESLFVILWVHLQNYNNTKVEYNDSILATFIVFNIIIQYRYCYILCYKLESLSSPHYRQQYQSSKKNCKWHTLSENALIKCKHLRYSMHDKKYCLVLMPPIYTCPLYIHAPYIYMSRMICLYTLHRDTSYTVIYNIAFRTKLNERM